MKNTETHTFNKGKLFSDAMDRFYAISGLEPEQAPTEEIEPTIYDLVNITGDTESNQVEFLKSEPLFFESQNKRFVPNKIKRAIERYASILDLREIHSNKETAIELCLIFVGNLSNAYYESENDGWKNLHSKILNEQVSNGNIGTYKKIVDLLMKGTKNGGPIIERSSGYQVEKYSYMYRLTDAYRNKGVTLYEFKTTEARNLITKTYFKQLSSAIENIIGKNLIELYKNIELPTEELIIARGRELVKQGYTTKKGKKLIMKNKRAKEYYGDISKLSFVEDNIELFKRLTENGYLIPVISEENAGGRVTDSFNLMPSWIRALCTIDGEHIVECDYSALHPNIAVKIYNGNAKYITHEAVAEELEMDVREVKIEHLSFFNHRWKNMYESPIFDFYVNASPSMVENIYADKKVGHKITTKKMFALEVEIMTSVISKLNNMGIYVMYVYDALYTTKEYAETVKNIMNEEIINHGVYTIAK